MNAIKATAILFTAITVVSAWAGPAEDKALRDAAVNLDLEGVKAALAKGAKPSAASPDKRPLTPISALGLGQTARVDQRDVALKIAKVLFDAGARFGPLDRQNFFFFI